jgi:hypothetical protein
MLLHELPLFAASCAQTENTWLPASAPVLFQLYVVAVE